MSEEFYTKIVGVSKTNDDGKKRRDIINNEVNEGDLLLLDREPDNPYDSNAIRVSTAVWQDQIGYLKAELASRLAPLMDEGWYIECYVANVTGGEHGSDYGVNVRLTINDPDETKAMAQKTAEKYQATSPSVKKKKNSIFTKVAVWWRSRSKKTRIWIIVIVIILLIYICGNL